MNNNLLKQFDKAISFFNATKIHKFKKAPKRMIYSKFLEFISSLFKHNIETKTKTFWGGEMLVTFPEVISTSIYKYHLFEEGLTYMLIEYLRPGMTFLDVGAHFGYFTLLGACLVGESGQVHAFEPSPTTFNILKINTSNYTNVKINNYAVSSKCGTAFINDYGIKYSAYNLLRSPRLPQDVRNKITSRKHKIELTTIDEYINKTRIKPDFIKIDVESSEYEILHGMNETIRKFHPIISVEVGDYEVEEVPPSKELIKYLVGFDYNPYEYSDGQIKFHKIKESYKYDNILFLPGK